MSLLLVLSLIGQQPRHSDFDLFRTPPKSPTVTPEKPSPPVPSTPHTSTKPPSQRPDPVRVSILMQSPPSPVQVAVVPPVAPQWRTVWYNGQMRTVLGYDNPNGSVNVITDALGVPMYEMPATQYVVAPPQVLVAPTTQYVVAPPQVLVAPTTQYMWTPTAPMYYLLTPGLR